jgi:dipeptidyl aminopeptidase/acylaminoacyl peptidase
VGHTHATSDLHCNDWGLKAGQDIIEGVNKVLKAKPFIDPERIGCYGGSYGGFMTMSLITRTDLFKAACSLYGISNLASYWGGGIWGYTYGDTAMAGRYPWTHPEFFVERSPLYQAHKVKAALLLLHGEADVNVPSLESEQMFTALKVLGKEAAYVRFKGEDHGISGKRSNLLAHRSMILEWFDKHLKGQPEGWDARWKK